MKKYNTRFKSSFYYADGMKDSYLKRLPRTHTSNLKAVENASHQATNSFLVFDPTSGRTRV